MAPKSLRLSPRLSYAPGEASLSVASLIGRPLLAPYSPPEMTGDAGCSKTSAGITYPFTRGLASMLYLRNLWLSLFHPLILRGTLFCAAPRLPGYPPKNERSSDDSDLGGGSVPESFTG